MAGNSVKSLYPWVKQTSEQIFVFLFLQFSCLADKINRIYMPVCPSESMWVFMFKLAAFPGVNAMLPLITMWWCALKTVSVYVAEKSCIPLWNYMLNSLICMACKNPLFQEGKKKQCMNEAPGVFPGQSLTPDLLRIPQKFFTLRQQKNLCCCITGCKFWQVWARTPWAKVKPL